MEEDLNFTLEEGPWFLGNSGLYVRKWSENFNPKIEIISKVPVWVQMYGLPQHLWNLNVVKLIGNTLGEFMKIDWNFERKEQAMIARIYVKLNIKEPLPSDIKINSKLGIWTQ